MADKMSEMERSIETIINVFHEYSTRLGHPDTINQKEFKQLVQKELADFLKKEKKDDAVIQDIMEDLDTNQDKQLSFEEFVVLVGRLTQASHEKMHSHTPRGKHHKHGPGLGEDDDNDDDDGHSHDDDHGHSHGHGHGHSHGHGHGHSHGHGHGHSH